MINEVFMKIRPGFILRDVADVTIVVPAGAASLDFNGMVTLNETGKFLWQLLQEERSEDELLKEMLKEYDADEPTARAGIEKFVSQLKKEGLLA